MIQRLRICLSLLVVFIYSMSVCRSATVTDLPVKKVNNKSYYYYKVKKGDSLYSLATEFDITESEIINFNPAAADGLKTGLTLYFPTDQFSVVKKENDLPADYTVKKGDTLFSIAGKSGISTKDLIEMNPGVENGVKEGMVLKLNRQSEPMTVKPVDDGMLSTSPIQPAIEQVPTKDGIAVAVCLPFELENDKPGKSAQYALDFYRGFLLGIDSLRAHYGNPAVSIKVFDTESREVPFGQRIVSPSELSKVDIILAPENLEILEQLGRIGKSTEKFVLNTFQARDSSYLVNPYMLQCNVPASLMYEKAIDFFISDLKGATPVVLDNERAKKDKQSFVDALCSELLSKGINYKTLKYDGSLTSSAITDNLPVEDADFVFIPMAGSLVEFQKFASALSNYKEAVENSETPGKVRLFGYPEYTRFNGEAYERLKNIGTKFYSRFYNDVENENTLRFVKSYVDRYGVLLPDGVPNQALYGFDVAKWLLAVAANGGVAEETIEGTEVFDNLQMNYRFRPAEGGGYYNDLIYIVTLENGSPVKTEVF